MREKITWLILAAAAVLTGAGLWLGQHALVLQKAVRVCLECVGIG